MKMMKTKRLYLMRHATSQHNSQKTIFKKEKKYHQPKAHPDYQHVKFNKQLIDSNILNASEITIAKAHLNLSTIEVIFCSPLKRCLETCRELINGHEGKIHVKVLPQLNSRLSAAWSIGSNITALKQSYPTFDFSLFKGIQSTWMLTLLPKQQQQQPTNIAQPPLKTTKPLQNQQHLLQLLKQNKGQSYHQFYIRINKLKILIFSLINEYNSTLTKNENENGDVLIISHSCVLNFLLGKELDEKGKVKNKVSFEHCMPKCFNFSEIEMQPIKMAKL